MRRVRMVAAGFAVVLAVSSPAILTVPAAGADVTETAAWLDRMTVRIHGSAAELRAAERLNHHRIEGGVAACMRAAGRPYDPVPFESFYRDFTDADVGYGTGQASVADSLTDGPRRQFLNDLAFARLRHAGATERRADPADVPYLNACTARFEHRMYYDLDVRDLPFDDLFAAAFRDAALATAFDGYRSCMRTRYGVDVGDRSDYLFTPRYSQADVPLPGATPSRAWIDGVAATRAAFAADADCRRPAYDLAMPLLAPHLPAWERRHATELAAIRAEWHRRVTEAAQLPPTLGG